MLSASSTNLPLSLQQLIVRRVAALFCAIASVAATARVATADQPIQWTTASGGNGHWYLRINAPEGISWTAADAAARAIGGHLVTPSTAAEQAWVLQTFVSGAPTCGSGATLSRSIWIGLRQDATVPDFGEPGGGWRWVTGENFGYLNWAFGEPNDGASAANFAAMDAAGGWDDLAAQPTGVCVAGFLVEWSADCNADGVVDLGQILAGQLADANSNRVPDCCEGIGTPTDDCNGNGQLDACELAVPGADADGDLVLDQCEWSFGDLNRDGEVGAQDLALLLSAWGSTTPSIADLNNDGQVGAQDLALLLSRWGQTPPWMLPKITTVTPGSGPLVGGTSITIKGWNLSGATGVTVGGNPATSIVVVNGTTVTAVTPPGALGASTVVVSTSFGSAVASGAFTYTSPVPVVSAISPRAGSTVGGEVVAVTGSGFLAPMTVTVGGAPATAVTVVSETSATFVTPARGVGPATVVLTTPFGSATAPEPYRYVAVPSWATVLEPLPDPAVVTNPDLRDAIIAVGRPWRVRHTATQIELLLIPPGSFSMGCSASLAGACAADESPVHPVTLPEPLYLGRYEVTQAQWTAVMGSNPSQFQGASAEVPAAQVPNRPVEKVSWNMVQDFLAAQGMRLPTEAEWEYAYRAGTTTAFHSMPAFPSGTNDDARVGDIAWFSGNAVSQTRPVGQKAANGFGLFDVAGNVWEWVSDKYAPNYYTTSVVVAPRGPSVSTGDRVARGSAWFNGAVFLRASARGFTTGAFDTIGFRVVRSTTDLPQPFVTNISPVFGGVAGGTTITISGLHLAGTTAVTIGGVPATSFTVVSPTQVTAVVPAASAGAKDVSITTGNGTDVFPRGFFQSEAPTITGVNPNRGPTVGGTSITITGTNFADGSLPATVRINGVSATNVSVVNPTTITAVTPAGTAGAKIVSVTTQAGTANLSSGFTYFAEPTVTAVSPATGPAAGGTAITITGTNFYNGATNAAVSIGGVPATNVTVVNSTTITATTPAGAPGVGLVSVTTPSGTATLASGFTYLAAPTVTAVTPNSGSTAGGTAIQISGSGFVSPSTVTIGGASSTSVTVVSGELIVALTPTGTAGAATVSVTNAGGSASLPNAFTYVAPPTISAVTPNQGPTAGGTTVIITGSGFFVPATVTIGGVAATSVQVLSSSTLTAVTPAGAAGSANVSVTTPFGTVTNTGAFAYFAPPTIVSVSPTTGLVTGGTAITITGSNLTGTNSVAVGGVAATSVVVVNASAVTAVTPAGTAGPRTIALTTPGGTASLTNGFSYVPNAPPTVSAVSPSAGPAAGGTPITITGTNFYGGSTPPTVTVGGVAATSVTVVNATTITASTPAGTLGAKTVSVTTPSGAGSLSSGFTFIGAPTISSVTPGGGPITGGTSITITGTNFYNGSTNATVTVGGVAATSVVVVNATTITAVTPAGTAGAKTVSVTTPSGTANLTNGFTLWSPPTLSAVSPNKGSVSGGTTITITGTNFYNGATNASVSVGGVAATSVNVVNATTMTAVTPAGTAGAKTVSVTTPSGTIDLPSAFTYFSAPTVTAVSPAAGPLGGGTTITITGTNFYNGATNATVSVGGVAATSVTVVSTTTITAVTPAGTAGAKTVSVATPSGTANLSNGFTYVGVPTVTSVSPSGGPPAGGTTITITGTNFHVGTPNSTISVGGVAATSVTVVNATTMTAVTPAGTAGAKTVSVTTPGGT
ncbi:MAG: hypothetical protein RLY21_1406, partial [Planctomycetota bacterium]